MQREGPTQAAVRAVVGKVEGGVDKPYLVAHVEVETQSLKKGDVITLSLSDWPLGEDPPRQGQVIDITGIRWFRQGWRGSSASSVTPQTKGVADE